MQSILITDGMAGVRRIDLLGFPVDAIDRVGLDRWFGETLGLADSCRHLVTLNPEYVMQARHDPAFASALRAANLSVADGIGVAKAASWIASANGARMAVPRIPGVEMVEMIAALPEDIDARVFLLGAGPGVAAMAGSVLHARYPSARITGFWDGGSPHFGSDEESLRRIRESGARVVLVAYGAAGQIGWIVRNHEELSAMGVRLAIGVGGAFDFISGKVVRAPEVVQRLGLEWLYRLVREPWRLKRQLVLPYFAVLTVMQVIRIRFCSARRSPS